MERFRAFRRGACEEYGTLFGLGYIFIGFPLQRFLGALDDMVVCDTLGDKRLRVPTFYSSYDSYYTNNNKDFSFFLVMGVGTVFGAVHCIAWSFHFATLQERWVWRISAILVLGVPISFFPVGLILDHQGNKPTWRKVSDVFVGLIFFVFVFLYFIARMVLLVLPFVALRALPPGAYVQLDWVSFLPHI
jgi:hypothetical protein